MSPLASPQELFPAFYGNSAIRALAGASRWTVSGRLGDDVGAKGKAPIDMRALLDIGRVRGAWSVDDQCLVRLDELTGHSPDGELTTLLGPWSLVHRRTGAQPKHIVEAEFGPESPAG